MTPVDPAARGRGLGKRLAAACVQRACSCGAPVLALHTTPIMRIALPMYLRMGFGRLRDAPPIHGVPYAIYVKNLADESDAGCGPG